MTQEIRLVLYGLSAVLFIGLAYNLIRVRHILARWFGALLVANAVNSSALFIMLFYLKSAGDTSARLAQFVWTLNALITAAVAVGLCIAFYRATRNGNGP